MFIGNSRDNKTNNDFWQLIITKYYKSLDLNKIVQHNKNVIFELRSIIGFPHQFRGIYKPINFIIWYHRFADILRFLRPFILPRRIVLFFSLYFQLKLCCQKKNGWHSFSDWCAHNSRSLSSTYYCLYWLLLSRMLHNSEQRIYLIWIDIVFLDARIKNAIISWFYFYNSRI